MSFSAPEGCLQYYRQSKGTINSFNWDGTHSRQYMPDQHYSICFKRQSADFELLLKRSLTAPTDSTSVGYSGSGPKKDIEDTASDGDDSDEDMDDDDVESKEIYSKKLCGPGNGCGIHQCSINEKPIDEASTTDNPNTDEPMDDEMPRHLRYDDFLMIPGAIYQSDGQYHRADFYCGSGVGGPDDREGVTVQTTGPFIITFHSDNRTGEVPSKSSGKGVRNELGFSLDYELTNSLEDLPITKPGQ